MGAREQIKRERQEGKTLLEKIKAQKGRFSAGKAYNANIVRIGETVLELLVGTEITTAQEVAAKQQQTREEYTAKVAAANEVKGLGKLPAQLTIKQLKVLIAPLKRKGDGAMPTAKAALVSKLAELEARGMLTVEEVALEVEVEAPAVVGAAAEEEGCAESDMEEDCWHTQMM